MMSKFQSPVCQTSRPQPSAAKLLAPETNARFHTLAAYGALLLIASIVFGTLTFRPF